MMNRMEKQQENLVKEMKKKLKPYLKGKTEKFMEKMEKDIAAKKEAPGAETLFYVIGYVYNQEGATATHSQPKGTWGDFLAWRDSIMA